MSVAFDELIEPYRRELTAHCYRMLGSIHDAEDVVQETYLRAWRARDAYDASRASVRTWMYRIATNACLTARAGDARRPMPSGVVAPSEPLAPFVPSEVTWLQPLPDALLDCDDPARTVIDRSTLRLAFVAALQHLSARQRAVLILRDVLDFSAAETAELIDATVISVNSALRRARATMSASGVRADDEGGASPEAEQRELVERYVTAFVSADVEGLKQLLAEDVLLEMPPMTNWFTGRAGYTAFMEWVFTVNGDDWRTVPVAANGQPGFAAYVRDGDGYRLHTLQILDVGRDGITRNSVFLDQAVFTAFGLAPRLTTA